MVNIWTTDTVILDYDVTQTTTNAALLDAMFKGWGELWALYPEDPLIKKAIANNVPFPELKLGRKNTLPDGELYSFLFMRLVVEEPSKLNIGGSSFNSVAALAELFDDDNGLNINFATALGSSSNSFYMRAVLEDAGVDLQEPTGGHAVRNASALIVQHKNAYGDITDTTYLIQDGNFREIMTPDVLIKDELAENDIFFLQGSSFRKLQDKYINKVLGLRWELDKELWFTLPTRESHARANAERIREEILPKADVITANDEELLWMYSTRPSSDPEKPYEIDESMTLEQALYALWEDVKGHKNIKAREGKMDKREPVAFITLGAKGSAIVVEQGIFIVPAVDLDKSQIQDRRGAGDSAYAAFFRTLLSEHEDLTYLQAAWLANQYAATKLQTVGPRVPDARNVYDGLSREVPTEVVQVLHYVPPAAGAEVDGALKDVANLEQICAPARKTEMAD